MEGFYDSPFAELCGGELPPKMSPDAATGGQGIFVELFAGRGALTNAVSKVMDTEPPQDFDTGGAWISEILLRSNAPCGGAGVS